MRTLFLRLPSFDAFDGGAEGRLAMDGDSRLSIIGGTKS
jgi:hypothetical protein